MRVLKIIDRNDNINNYIVIDKISRFFSEKLENGKYSVHIDAIGYLHPIAINIDNPDEIIIKLLNAIEVVDNNIINFSVIHNN